MPDISHLCALSQILSVSTDVLLGNFPAEERTFIGIDGGGTKTEFVLINEHGKLLNRILLGGMNPNAYGAEAACELLRRGIDALHPADMNVCGIYIGGAGLGSGNNAEIVRTLLRKAYPKIKIDCGTDICNVIACSSDPENCIAVICGTGSVVYSYQDGVLTRTGGAGYLLEKSGSGYDIGREALHAALQERDGSGEKTLLTAMVEERLGGTVWSCIHELYKKDISFIASFAPMVFDACAKKDAVAGRILQETIDRLAFLISVAVKKAPSAKTVVLSGSVFTKNDMFLTMLSQKLDPGLKTETLVYPQVWGACLQSARLCGLSVMPSVENFMEQYNAISF